MHSPDYYKSLKNGELTPDNISPASDIKVLAVRIVQEKKSYYSRKEWKKES